MQKLYLIRKILLELNYTKGGENINELYHYGVGHLQGGHSGRYPWNSGKKNQPKNVVSRDNINELLKYKMNIIGETHSNKMIDYYDKLLAKKKPEYFICEFADIDRCYNRKQLKERMDNATDGSYESDGKGADYQYNYWVYELAYKHNCKLIGCNPINIKKYSRMNDEDAYREKYMLNVLKEFDDKNAVVQLGDHHLRSIPIDNDFLNYTGDIKDERGIVSDLSVDNASPIWDYFKNRKDVSISREETGYQNELNYKKQLKHSELYHYGTKQTPDGKGSGRYRKNFRILNGYTASDIQNLFDDIYGKGAQHHQTYKETCYRNVIKNKGFVEMYRTPYGKGVGAIGVEVHPNAQRQGIGTKLVNDAIKAMPDLGLTRLEWYCKKSNIASERLAKKCGFITDEKLSTKDWWTLYYENGKKNNKLLNSFDNESISNKALSKYKDQVKQLSHVRVNKNTNGTIFTKNGKLVAMVNVENKDDGNTWIQGIEIFKDFKGKGLGTEFIDYAVNDLGATHLSVNKNNTIAKHLYDKYGFKVYKQDGSMYYMVYDKRSSK